MRERKHTSDLVSLGVNTRRSQKRDFMGMVGLTTGFVGPALPFPGRGGTLLPFAPILNVSKRKMIDARGAYIE